MQAVSAKKWAVVFGFVALAGCGPAPEVEETLSPEDEGASTQEITDVNHTAVKRQSIGNCWLYANASWAESMVKTQTGQEMNLSESYWTYWHWFEQIANGRAATEVQTGGSWGVGVELALRYGIMREADFIAEEAIEELSKRQASALKAINASLKSGALASSTARRNRQLVRSELDKAWALPAEIVARLDAAFGPAVSRTLDRSTVNVSAQKILRASDLPVGRGRDATGATRTLTLKDAIGTSNGWGVDSRTGPFAWTEVNYPSSASARRQLQIRIQRALHAKQPVISSWFVDFAALNAKGEFLAPPEKVGSQGGHMVVLEDYEIDNVPGYGTLPAGELETRPAALNAALSNSATLKFFRVKNSWGTARPGPIAGYHDLHMKYLNGPIQQCTQRADDPSIPDPESRACLRSVPTTPLWSVVLPPGF